VDTVGRTSGAGTYRFKYTEVNNGYVAVPDPTWPDMTSEEKDALAEFLKNLSVHEHGHLQIATRYVQRHPTVSFYAGSRAQAVSEIKQRLKAYIAAQDQEQKKYDSKKVTAHGGHQSRGPRFGFPGGDNVVLSCPRG
jgi:hypothetical protein